MSRIDIRFADFIVLIAALIAGAVPASVAAQGPENVLVVVNTAVPDSVQVGEYYQRKRRIPTDNLLRISAPAEEQLSRLAYESAIEGPISSWIGRHQAHDRLLFIVLTKGVPLRIAGTAGRTGTIASVDSELALLYRRMTGQPVAPGGSVPNPYFQSALPIAEARPFTHERQDIYLVTRLDGYTVQDVIGLIDRGSAPARDGRIILDQRASVLPEPGNQWLRRAADLLGGLGFADRVVLETTSQVVKNQTGVLGYYSWGSNDPAMTDRRNNLTFEAGALAAAFVSSDGRTFREPPAKWTHGRWDDPKTFHAGSPQSLAGDLIRQGITGVAGHVAEPFLDATIRPDVLFPAYVSGFTLAEAFYLAMPFLSWQTVVVGDPLSAPFRRQTLAAEEIDGGIDPATETPTLFAARALKLRAARPAVGAAAAMLLRAESRLARQNVEGAVETLVEATTSNPKLVEAHLLLAGLYERSGDLPRAQQRYRTTIALAPGHVVALNNLAFMLAGKSETAAEAVTLARTAAALAPQSSQVLDTLAWALHLSGDSAAARASMAMALRAGPVTADLLLHSAIIDAANGEHATAKAKLDKLLATAPAMQTNPEVQALRDRLGGAKPTK